MACSCDSQSVPCAWLVRDALAGDREAFAELIRKFTPLVIHIGRRYSAGGSYFDRDETVQDLAVHLLERRAADNAQRLALWSREGKFCAWFSSVVARMCSTKRRGLKSLRHIVDDDSGTIEPVAREPRPGLEFENRDHLAAIERTVSMFPVDHQIVFWNHFIHGLTYTELGRILCKNERVLRRWMDEIKAEIGTSEEFIGP